jgi:transposase
MVLPQGIRKFRTSVVRQLEAEQAKLTPLSTEVCWHLDDACLALENRVADDHEKLQALGQAHPQCQRVPAIPGLGPLTATAILAAVPDAAHVKNGRQLAAWLGLVPRGTRHGRQAPPARDEHTRGLLPPQVIGAWGPGHTALGGAKE